MLSALLALALPVVNAFITPDAIWGNNCVRANRGIYCFGGLQPGPTISSKMYHLDISTSWDSTAPPWSDLSDSNSSTTVPGINSAFAGAATLSDHSNILVNGGSTAPDLSAVSSSTAQFDTRTNTWSVPVISDRSLKQSRYYHSLLSDGQGRIWIWGGRDTEQYYNTWAVMDTTTWSISYPEIQNAPSPRIQHTATMVPDGKVIIIGGLTYSRNVTDPLGGQILNPVSMADLLLFDMATAKWTNLTAGGNVPAPRREHTSVLSRDSSSIIVFGGGDPRLNNVNMNDVFVLNLTSLLWSSPSPSNEPPPPRKSHQAIMVKDSMLIMFGNNGEDSAYNDVHIMDTANWSWKTQYDINDDEPKDTESMGSSAGANSQHVTSLQAELATKALFGAIILASALAMIGLICLIGSIISYHRTKSRQRRSKSLDNVLSETYLQDIRELIRMGTLHSQLHSSTTPQKPDIENDISSQKPNEQDSHR
ncbi:hypothetical protein BC943DRAFT_361412 [Umbelopsis sp. AD052]|nr:hypothetical protein BC943DRAFT_361412 [Umbelopsis sp. AD052]